MLLSLSSLAKNKSQTQTCKDGFDLKNKALERRLDFLQLHSTAKGVSKMKSRNQSMLKSVTDARMWNKKTEDKELQRWDAQSPQLAQGKHSLPQVTMLFARNARTTGLMENLIRKFLQSVVLSKTSWTKRGLIQQPKLFSKRWGILFVTLQATHPQCRPEAECHRQNIVCQLQLRHFARAHSEKVKGVGKRFSFQLNSCFLPMQNYSVPYLSEDVIEESSSLQSLPGQANKHLSYLNYTAASVCHESQYLLGLLEKISMLTSSELVYIRCHEKICLPLLIPGQKAPNPPVSADMLCKLITPLPCCPTWIQNTKLICSRI